MSLLLGWFVTTASAATFKLTDDKTVTGELLEAGSNDAAALIKTGNDTNERVPWANFSQDDLKEFKIKYASNRKIIDAVEPLIEVSVEEKAKVTRVEIKPTDPVVEAMQKARLEPKQSVIGSLFKSGLGIFLICLIYAANVYAGYEVGIFRSQPVALTAGLAAIPLLGVISNIVFLSMPSRAEKKLEEERAQETVIAETPTIVIPGAAEAAQEAVEQAQQTAAAGPQPEVYARGKFTFNKRFIETKFAAFFTSVRREEDKPKVLTFKTGKGEFVARRIARVSPTEIYIEADRGGGASVEMSLQFPEIQEITITHHHA